MMMMMIIIIIIMSPDHPQALELQIILMITANVIRKVLGKSF